VPARNRAERRPSGDAPCPERPDPPCSAVRRVEPLSDEDLGALVAEFADASVRAVALIGSYARGEADAFSDVDLGCFVHEYPERDRHWSGYRRRRLVAVVFETVAGELAGFRQPATAISSVPAFRSARLLLDREGELAALQRAALAFSRGGQSGSHCLTLGLRGRGGLAQGLILAAAGGALLAAAAACAAQLRPGTARRVRQRERSRTACTSAVKARTVCGLGAAALVRKASMCFRTTASTSGCL
jgi:hypothetical protein